MEDIRHDLHILVTMAKIDASLSRSKSELETIPEKKRDTEKKIVEIETTQKNSNERLTAMQKQHRAIEVGLEDNAELIKTKKTKLMGVKTNKEYSALLKEIELVENDIDTKEEKLLLLMDEIEEQKKAIESNSAKMSQNVTDLSKQMRELEERESILSNEIKELEAQKPALLKELDAQVKKRYDRLLAKLGDFAVTHVVDEVCQGCFSRMPPQKANEVKLNDRIITCVSCGRMLIHYEE